MLTSHKDLPSEDSQTKALSAARVTKKKGTATLVKKTTSRRTGTGSRAGRRARGGSKSATPSSFRPQGNSTTSGSARKGPGSSAASATASSPAPAGSSDAEGAAGAGSDAEGDESDHGPYCICRGPDDHRWMISCDVCEDWFHGQCVAIDKTIGEALIQRYVCPRCTDGEGINVTRYKKTCSLDGCFLPARIYEETAGAARGNDDAAGRKKGAASGVGGANYSVFCSDRHAEDWWEQLVRALPENGKLKAKDADLTREKFMGLLNVPRAQQSVEGEEPWSIGKKPFGEFLLSSSEPLRFSSVKATNLRDVIEGTNSVPAVPPEFWSKVDPGRVFTPEEQAFLSDSAAERYALAEEIVLNKKMQQLLDLANERRKAAISISLMDKDTCGYDVRLDLVGCPVEFALFARSAQGEAIYRTNSLASENTWTDEQLRELRRRLRAQDGSGVAEEDGPDDEDSEGGQGRARGINLALAGMCDRRRCKPHAGWYNIFTKSTRHVIKELARQAKEKLDAETRVREAAATRYFRKMHESTAVRRLDGVVAT